MSLPDQRACNTTPSLEHCTITARLHRFSSCVGHPACTEFDCDSDIFHRYVKAKFYANGSCTEDEGHVSIIFERNRQYRKGSINMDRFSCTTSVVDASGSERFPQSFAFCYSNLSIRRGKHFHKGMTGFHKFIQRSTLLNDSSELLPDDCLTLRLEIDYQVKRLSKYDDLGFKLQNGMCCLLTNSDFVRDLFTMSAVFRSMLESPMAEKLTGSVSIPQEECESLKLIFKVLSDYDLYTTPYDLYQLYIFADKYDMQEIVHLSHQLLISIMRTAANSQEISDYVEKSGLHMISELAERFDDQTLKDILKSHSHIKNKFEGSSGTLEFPDDVNPKTEWDYELSDNSTHWCLHFTKIRKENFQSDSFK